MQQKEIICVGCPMGCRVILGLDSSGEVVDYSGNECKQGKKYAKQEYENPVRIFTATVRTKTGPRPLLPVRTNGAVPKDKMVDCARLLSTMQVEPPVEIGDIIISNILDTGTDLICCADLKE